MDYESPPDDNLDYAHATYWSIQWQCRCGMLFSTSSSARYITQTCRKCGVKWEISPTIFDTTVHDVGCGDDTNGQA